MRAGIALDDIGKINALDLAFRADGDRLPPKGQLAGRPLSEDARQLVDAGIELEKVQRIGDAAGERRAGIGQIGPAVLYLDPERDRPGVCFSQQ